jgi:predicted permease
VWDDLLRDLRYAARSLSRSPGYALTAILTLGVGIGANTAMFSVVNGALLHPLPYQHSDRLIRILEETPKAGQPTVGVSIPETWEYRDRLRGVEDLVEYHSMTFVLLDRGDAARVNTGVVSSQFFDVFGITPLYGRTFTKSDDLLGAEPVLVLGYEYWQSTFGGDPHVVGQTVRMNDKVHTIVGVLPPIPQYPRTNDIFMPTSACPFRAAAEPDAVTNHRAFAGLSVFARLKEHTPVSQVSADAAAIAAGWATSDPRAYQADRTGFHASAQRLEDQITENARPILLTLAAATMLVLLIACANVANLSLARLIARDRELALRAALGAGRSRLIRQLLAESTLLGAAGGLLGLALAWPSAGLLARFASRFTPRAVDASIDGSVLLFTLVLAVLTGVTFGAVPAFSSRRRVAASLRDGGMQSGDGVMRTRLRGLLVVAQVTVCFALVVGAGLFLRSLHRLASVDTGYQDAEHLLTAQISGNFSRQQAWTPAEFLRFHTTVLERVGQLPGVRAAAITNGAPLTGAPGATPFTVAGLPEDPELRPTADRRVASDDYFTTLGIPLRAGRAFNWSDTPDSLRVAIVNESMAHAWNGRNPVGTTFRAFGGNARAQRAGGTEYTVIGVAADTRQYSLDQAPMAQFYTPVSQSSGFGAQVLIKTGGDPHQIIAGLKDVVRAVDNTIPVSNIATATELRDEQLQSPRLTTGLLTTFALLALTITLGGIAAVIATSVSQRTREFGIRMALGASRGSVILLVLRQGLLLIGAGLALGIAGALAFRQVLARYLYATDPADPLVYAGVALIVLMAGLLACVGPARRATAIDPLAALRST